MPDPRHHPRERRIRALGNGIMFVAMLLGVAALVATILVIGSPVAALPGAVLAIGIIGIAAKYAPVPADPRHAEQLAADLAELPDRREAALYYGAVLDGDDIALVWVRWKRVLWLLLAGFLVLIAVVSVTGDIRNPGIGIALAALCLLKVPPLPAARPRARRGGDPPAGHGRDRALDRHRPGQRGQRPRPGVDRGPRPVRHRPPHAVGRASAADLGAGRRAGDRRLGPRGVAPLRRRVDAGRGPRQRPHRRALRGALAVVVHDLDETATLQRPAEDRV